MLHIFAALAEKERHIISQRTKAAFAAAKASGQQLGDPGIGKRNRAAADAYAESLRAIVTPMVGMTTRAIAGTQLSQHQDPAPRLVAIAAGDAAARPARPLKS